MMRVYCTLDEDIDNDIYTDGFRSADAFGGLCPDNMEEVAEFLRHEVGRRADEYIRKYGPKDERDGWYDDLCDIYRNVWEDYCAEQLPGCPTPIYDGKEEA